MISPAQTLQKWCIDADVALFSVIIQRATGSSCEADLGQDQSDQTDFKVDSDGGGEWKLSLKEVETKVDQAVAGVDREVGGAIFMNIIQLLSYIKITIQF